MTNITLNLTEQNFANTTELTESEMVAISGGTSTDCTGKSRYGNGLITENPYTKK